eukprot:m.26265 g.26265  ORF g.26265 m.26265 type:complete len:126 (+) comp8808_c0_seq1:39-416(+)
MTEASLEGVLNVGAPPTQDESQGFEDAYSDRPAVHNMAKQLFGKQLRITVKDGRVLEGILVCIDRDMAMIMSDAVEYGHVTLSEGKPDPASYSRLQKLRNLPGVIVPGNSVVAAQLRTATVPAES